MHHTHIVGHGDLLDRILGSLPEHRLQDVVLIARLALAEAPGLLTRMGISTGRRRARSCAHTATKKP